MSGTDVALLGLIGLSCANAFRFENKIAKQLLEIEELKKPLEMYQSAFESDKVASLLDQIGLRKTATYFEGNWLPSKYRQFIFMSVLALGVTAVDSSRAGLFVFSLSCLFFSTGALRFWLGLMAKVRRVSR